MASEQPEKETTVSTMWGPVAIFNGTNYPFFENSVVMAMAAANALGFLDDTETIVAVPAETDSDIQWKIYQSYIKRKGYAISILNSAINDIQRAAIVELIQAGDITGSWNKLVAMDPAQHPSYVANVRETFFEETFDPKTQTIRQFIDILLSHQMMISTSKGAICDLELRSVLLEKLPNTGIWRSSRYFAIDMKLSLERTIMHLVVMASLPIPKSDTNDGDAVNSSVKKNDKRRGSEHRFDRRTITKYIIRRGKTAKSRKD
ncbi:uncharacterized protein EAF02_001543 [Botrytis sinoallii]|uniref:uncharacterized protein n=1 Tax=Botrytis sinoallii TaxID=1463999 RepID=UPI001900BC04|nr:uncharacterized protein EAF02_001543 [Botrytis sinoallii]KAF7891218.1 hypothetical protein EAF02_001543 [Botrytis sinoallii]